MIVLIVSIAIFLNVFGSSNAMENMANQNMPLSCKAICDAYPIGQDCAGCILNE